MWKTGHFCKSKAKVDFYHYKLLYVKENIHIHKSLDTLLTSHKRNFNRAFSFAELLICFWFETSKVRSPPVNACVTVKLLVGFLQCNGGKLEESEG